MKVLLVEDSEDIRYCVRQVFTKRGFTLTETTNGQEGLDALKEGQFDFVLCDIKMPVLDGVGFLRGARKQFKDIPIFVISSFSTYTDEEILEAGATAQIGEKPLSDEAVNKILELYQKTKTL